MSIVNDKRKLGREEPEEQEQNQAPEENGAETAAEAETNPAEEIAALKDTNLRLHAEFDNYRKRSERELASFRKYANQSLVKELLPQIDNLERALESTEDTADPLIEGLKMTLKGIEDALAKFGVSRVESVGQPFDPNVHEAITAQISAEVDDNTVLAEHQSGYMLHDRLIRPAMVVVSKKPAE